ncbi:MAG: putative toxin-antitoxin system toxin component, PIN family [Bacteroidota bacterium]
MIRNKPYRIVIDTNLWISFLISNSYNKLDEFLLSGKIRIFFSAELLDEISVTITKPKLRKHFGSYALEKMLLYFEPFIDIITVKSIVSVCRDSNDNFLLALAKDSKADFLLTGDRDLLDIKKFDKTKIVTITSFLELLKDQD